MTTTTFPTNKGLAHMTLEEADNWYRQGVVSQDQFEAYMHVWQTSCFRYSTTHVLWEEVPTDSNVVAIVEAMRAFLPLA